MHTDSHKFGKWTRKSSASEARQRCSERKECESRIGKRLALSVSQMPRAVVCTVSPTRPSRLSRPPASLWEMYASGAGLAGSSSAWAGKMAHWQLLLHYVSKLYTLHTCWEPRVSLWGLKNMELILVWVDCSLEFKMEYQHFHEQLFL